MLLIDGPHRVGGRAHRHRRQLVVYRVPHGALIRVAAARIAAHAAVDRLQLAPAAAGEVRAVRAPEHDVVVIPPAAALDARHRNPGRLLRRRQDRDVERPVLPGADELLALDQQHRPVGPVPEQQLRDAPVVRHLGYLRRSRRERLVQRQVAARGGARPAVEQREHGHLPLDARFPKRQAGNGLQDDLHGSTLLVHVWRAVDPASVTMRRVRSCQSCHRAAGQCNAGGRFDSPGQSRRQCGHAGAGTWTRSNRRSRTSRTGT